MTHGIFTAAALSVAMVATPLPPAWAQGSSGSGNVRLLDAAGALTHARLSGRLAADVSWLWASHAIRRPRLEAWTRDVLDTAVYSLSLIQSARAVPRAGSLHAVEQSLRMVQASLSWQEPQETARLLRQLAHDLSVLDGGPPVAGSTSQTADEGQPPTRRGARPRTGAGDNGRSLFSPR